MCRSWQWKKQTILFEVEENLTIHTRWTFAHSFRRFTKIMCQVNTFRVWCHSIPDILSHRKGLAGVNYTLRLKQPYYCWQGCCQWIRLLSRFPTDAWSLNDSLYCLEQYQIMVTIESYNALVHPRNPHLPLSQFNIEQGVHTYRSSQNVLSANYLNDHVSLSSQGLMSVRSL